MMRPQVLLALEWVPTYRTNFLEQLRVELASSGIDLLVIHGDPPKSKAKRGTEATLTWAQQRPNHRTRIRGIELCWQPVLRDVRKADLVIAQQEAKLVLNLLLALGLRRRAAWALWGHGENFNPHDRSGLGERLKAWQTRRAGRFFAYTERSARSFARTGADPDCITVVNNAVDPFVATGNRSEETARLVAAAQARSDHICWMNSSLDQWKRLEFLGEALDHIRFRCPDFEFFVIGDGEGRSHLEDLSSDRPWLHVLGAQFGDDKRLVGAASKLMLHPGLVGLHVVEAFQFRTPLVTTDIDYHSHEIEYLTSGVDGLTVPAEATPASYAEEVSTILNDDVRLDEMSAAAGRKAEIYTVEAAVKRFADGVRDALGDERIG